MDCKEVHLKIQGWLQERLKESNQRGFVIGVSGGIDSALVSTLCASTGFPTFVISLPINQEAKQLQRANKHIQWLKDKYGCVVSHEIDLTEITDCFEKTLQNKQINSELVSVNLRSRLRMVALYAMANQTKLLVAGTGNKIEDFAVGFFTKGGDGCCDISPIGDLLKSEVRQLAAFLGVDSEIVNAVPTDGLWGDNRSDEEQLGATYDELEWALNYYETLKIVKPYGIDLDKLPQGFSVESIVLTQPDLTERQKEVFSIFTQRHFANKHKMEMPPICYLQR